MSNVEEAQEAHLSELLSEAIENAMNNAKGWDSEEARKAYIDGLLDEDFLPALFCETEEELAKTGTADAFSSLLYDDPPATYLMQFKSQGNRSFQLGKQNQANNKQYYRDAANEYYQALAWADRVQAVDEGFVKPTTGKDSECEYFTVEQLDELRATLYANAAMAHLQIKNAGHARDNCQKALKHNPKNVKAWYRLAKAFQLLQNWAEAGDAIDSGLENCNETESTEYKELIKLQRLLEHRVRRARQLRQQQQRARAERVAQVKQVWKHCKESNIRLGRVALVSRVSDDDDDDEHDVAHAWHHHFPHTGKLPKQLNDEWSWPCMFLYPSHHQSDFIECFAENEIFALRIAQVFPDLEDCVNGHTAMPWDSNDEFVCSNLAVYFEVHTTTDNLIHPQGVECLTDQASCMRYYEASRALKGDEGPEIQTLAELTEKKHLLNLRKAWTKKHGSLWCQPPPNPLVRVHPAMTLREVLTHSAMVVPSFLPTFYFFPVGHPAEDLFLKEHPCVEVLQPQK